jgi:hypothetical protein
MSGLPIPAMPLLWCLYQLLEFFTHLIEPARRIMGVAREIQVFHDLERIKHLEKPFPEYVKGTAVSAQLFCLIKKMVGF